MSRELSDAQQFVSWMNIKSQLNEIAPNAAKRFVKRGQVYWCHFGLNIGSEISKSTPRPAVIVSNFTTNKNSSNVIVVPITHNQAQLPCLVSFPPVTDANENVILDGKVDTAGVICVSKARLKDMITTFSASQMESIDKSLLRSLNLAHYHINEENKYNNLIQYTEQVKEDRNKAQDTLEKLKQIISQEGFTENSQGEIKDLLDI